MCWTIPTISDYDFDQLLEQLMALEKQFPEFLSENSPSQRVGGQITKNFQSVKHQYAMLSLSNSYNQEDLLDFDRRVKEGLGIVSQGGLFDEGIEYVCELKFDGLSISLIYEDGQLKQAITRGDGVQGDDVTTNAKTIKSIPLKLKGTTLLNLKYVAKYLCLALCLMPLIKNEKKLEMP
jgi:DNA ligase (NAD+)